MATVQNHLYSIRDLADEFDITTRTIRFYEDKGLISPERHGQKRIYHKRDRTRLTLILRGKRLGFSLEEIQHLVNLYETPQDQVPQLEEYLETLRSHKSTLAQRKQDLEKTLDELTQAESDCAEQLQRLLNK